MALDLAQVEIADFQRHRTGGRRLRAGGDEVDRLHHDAATEQCALEALQNLDPVEIEHRDIRPAWTADVDAVLKDRDPGQGRGEAVVGGDAADVDRGVVHALLDDAHPRNEIRQSVDLVDPLFLEELGTEVRHGDRHIDRCLFALLRGDDHLVDDPVALLGDARQSHGEAGGEKDLVAHTMMVPRRIHGALLTRKWGFSIVAVLGASGSTSARPPTAVLTGERGYAKSEAGRESRLLSMPAQTVEQSNSRPCMAL